MNCQTSWPLQQTDNEVVGHHVWQKPSVLRPQLTSCNSTGYTWGAVFVERWHETATCLVSWSSGDCGGTAAMVFCLAGHRQPCCWVEGTWVTAADQGQDTLPIYRLGTFVLLSCDSGHCWVPGVVLRSRTCCH